MSHRVFAFIRFSYLYRDAAPYAIAKDLPLDERRNALYADTRMERRFEVFEHVCLPSLAAQPADVFGAVLLASDLMPERHRARLDDLLSPYPNLVATFRSPELPPFSEGFLEPLRRFDDVDDIVMTCRLDDDDALSSDYTDAALPFIGPSHVGYCLSFPRGLQAASVDGQPRFWQSDWPLVGAGLGLIDHRDSARTVYDVGHHHRVWEHRPTIVDAGGPRYMVTQHGENDSTARTRERRRHERPHRSVLRSVRDSLGRGNSTDHEHDVRNAPEDAQTLGEARARFPGKFAPLDEGDWRFL